MPRQDARSQERLKVIKYVLIFIVVMITVPASIKLYFEYKTTLLAPQKIVRDTAVNYSDWTWYVNGPVGYVQSENEINGNRATLMTMPMGENTNVFIFWDGLQPTRCPIVPDVPVGISFNKTQIVHGIETCALGPYPVNRLAVIINSNETPKIHKVLETDHVSIGGYRFTNKNFRQ